MGDDALHLILEASPSAMFVVDAAGRIVLSNAEAQRAFGYDRGEMEALRVEDLVPARFREHHAAEREAHAAHPSRRGMGTGRELVGLRKDGTEVPVEIGLNPVDLGGQRFVLASVIDITERLQGQAEEKAASDDLLRRSILDSIPSCIIVTDVRGRIVAANPAAEQLLGHRQDELVGRWITDIDAAERARHADGTPALRRVGVAEAEWTYRHKDGRAVPVNEAVVPLGSAGRDAGGFIIVSHDITQRVEARERLAHLATHDGLTNLPNRSLLSRHLDRVFERADVAGRQVALLLLDLDHFKRVNDSLGHDLGDELLVVVAERLLSRVRHHDLVARLGGDEFVIVLDDLDATTDLDQRLGELLEAVLAPVVLHGHELRVTGSIGGTIYPADGDDPATLLKHADIAMYAAKSAGRNTVRWFEHRMLEDDHDGPPLPAALRRAMDRSQPSLV